MDSFGRAGRGVMGMYYTNFESPLGPLLLAANERGLCLIHFAAGKRPMNAQPDWKKDDGIFVETISQLLEYFRGNLRQFDLPLALEGTPFQISRVGAAARDSVWRDDFIRRAGAADWAAKRGAGGGAGERVESDSDYCALPSGDR